MKLFLILFLISNSVYANFIKKNKVGSCENLIVYTKMELCGNDCINIPDNYSCEYQEIKPESWSKKDTELCGNNMDCQEKLSLKVCDEGYTAIKNLDDMEVYCTKYNPERIGNNAVKKAEYDAAKELERQNKEQEKTELQEIKALVQTVNDSNLPAWHKKILKRLIKDMKGE